MVSNVLASFFVRSLTMVASLSIIGISSLQGVNLNLTD